ncbi:MAG TPA: helix-turn-helix transcriptional regulator [Thermoanaerobaculia bacterium]
MAFENMGKALGILRRDRSLSRKQLCAHCRIGAGQLSRYEAGKELMKLSTLERILAELAITPEEFFRFLASLGDSPAAPMRKRDRFDSRQLADAFERLNACLDGVRDGIGILAGLVVPRVARAIDQASLPREEDAAASDQPGSMNSRRLGS